MRTLQYIVLLAMFGCAPESDEDAPVAVVVDLERARETLNVAAEEMRTASLESDFERMADLSYPRLLELMGGHDAYLEKMKWMSNDLQARGFSVSELIFNGENQLVAAAETVYAIVPHEIHMSGPWFARGITSTYFVAVSKDGGNTWTFSGGDPGGDESQYLEELFPDLPDELVLPPHREPQWGSIFSPPESSESDSKLDMPK